MSKRFHILFDTHWGLSQRISSFPSNLLWLIFKDTKRKLRYLEQICLSENAMELHFFSLIYCVPLYYSGIYFYFKHTESILPKYIWNIFFLLSFSFKDSGNSQDSRERKVTIFNSTLPFPCAHKLLDIYWQLWMWDDHHIFLITSLVFTRLLFNEIFGLTELPFDWLIKVSFCFFYLVIWF